VTDVQAPKFIENLSLFVSGGDRGGITAMLNLSLLLDRSENVDIQQNKTRQYDENE
jgi:hypothetical protein